MITDDIIRTIERFTAQRGRGPNSITELQESLVAELNTPVSDTSVISAVDDAQRAGFIGIDNRGCYTIL